MAVDNEKVGVAITGAVYRGQSDATAPTGTASALTKYDDLGWIGEDGVSRTLPDAGDAETIVGWQNGAQIRIIRKPSDENPTFEFVLLETKKEAIEAALEVTITQTSTEGSYVIDTTKVRGRHKWVLDVIDGSELERQYIGIGEVIALGETVYANGEAIGYPVTVEAHRDAAIGGQVKVWSTRLKSTT